MSTELPPVARRHVWGAMGALTLVLAVMAPRFGYHRDELYFRMLPPAWGYVDQPPLIPFLARTADAISGDSLLGLRLVALLCAVASIPVLTLITREVGGGRLAQALTAWGMAGATMTLSFGHVLFTASIDLLVWPAVLLFVIRAVLREQGSWWLYAGVVAGVSTYNKLLIVVLLAGIAAGLALFGPWRWWRSWQLWAAVGIVVVLAAPNLIYQVTNDWPQVAMGDALREDNAGEVRVLMWLFLLLLPGPILAVFWAIGAVAPFRRPEWRPLRLLSVVLAVTVVFVFVGGTQYYYTAGILAVLVAIGSVVVADWVGRSRLRRRVVIAAVAINAALCAITSLPLLPVAWLGSTGLAGINPSLAEQVGWQTYVAQIDAVADRSNADVIVASNYGEAGALDRFGTSDVPVVSGHNALWDLGGPPADARTVVIVGGQLDRVEQYFASCAIEAELDNGADVPNEEQGEPVAVCRDPLHQWDSLWPEFRHLS